MNKEDQIQKRQNVLFIICDALRKDYLSCYGNTEVHTPNIDRLASQGVIFTNYFAVNSICMPNRATLLTGLYPNTHGVRSNGMKLSENIPTLTQTLINRGWHTGAIGKIHHQFWMGPISHKYKSAENIYEWVLDEKKQKKKPVGKNFPLPYYGYEEVELVIGNGSVCSGHYTKWLDQKNPKISKQTRDRCYDLNQIFELFCDPIPEELNSSTYITERTIAFLERQANGKYGEKPFYLHCSFPDPHYPIAPPERFLQMYPPKNMSVPDNFYDSENLYNHPFLSGYLTGYEGAMFKRALLRETSVEEMQKIKAYTYASLTYIDECVGKIVQKLEDLGMDKNTIIIFTSDHGDLMGDHGLLFKGPCPYDSISHIPLIWVNPEKNNQGETCSAMMSSVDYAPTLLSKLGILERFQPEGMEGMNLASLLENPKEELRKVCMVEGDEEINPMHSRLRKVITKEYAITVYENFPNYADIYDRKKDPMEIHNLWYDRAFKDKKHELIDLVLHTMLKTQSHKPKRIAGT
ncbi:MAG: sulfatase family protein [Promethearchaeota archaeon]